MQQSVVLSLYDYTGEALKPWAKAGYFCYALDIQHPADLLTFEEFEGGGRIQYANVDLYNKEALASLKFAFKGRPVAFVFGFPPCTDLAVSGAAHFKKKRLKDPLFQEKAAGHAKAIADLAQDLNAPYLVENPVSVLSTLWRKPDYSFHPFEYGGYIPEAESLHPSWPDYIPASDAYKKKTCLWTGGGFKMPAAKPVPCSEYYGNGYSKPMMKLGGKSQKTKNIRSATPRGFAQAVFEANATQQQADLQAAE